MPSNGPPPFFPKAFVDERFAFYGKSLSGIPQLRPRWQRGMDYTSAALGEAVGKVYVERYFPAATKAKAQAMVDDLVQAFAKRIDALAWMSPATKAKAKQKLDTLKVGVGYPDRWQDYSSLEVVKGDALGNSQRAELFEYHRHLAKLRQPVDRGEWWMTPQTVNAVNLPLQNALNFPAAIIQPPYFDADADAAHNYGSMGAIIGHEISHSFDDQGSQFDAAGRLANWWTKEDFDHFKAAGEALAAQFDTYRPFPDLAVNGHQTLSENIADVAGLLAAYDAYRLSLHGKPDVGERRLHRRSAVHDQLRAKLAIPHSRCGNAQRDRYRRPCSRTVPRPDRAQPGRLVRCVLGASSAEAVPRAARSRACVVMASQIELIFWLLHPYPGALGTFPLPLTVVDVSFEFLHRDFALSTGHVSSSMAPKLE